MYSWRACRTVRLIPAHHLQTFEGTRKRQIGGAQDRRAMPLFHTEP